MGSRATTLKSDPLAVATIQQLVAHTLTTGVVDLHTCRPGHHGFPLLRKHRGVDLALVASQYFELTCAGGIEWSKVGTSWNGTSNLIGFDFDYDEDPDHDARGCNHPDIDGGNAIANLRRLIKDATGGDVVLTRNPGSNGIWALAVTPVGVDGRALAQFVLRQMADDGFHVGAGMLESPMGNARLPLAGYELVGHERLPWIEQVGTLLGWIEEQLQTVSLTIDLPTSSEQSDKVISTPIVRGQVAGVSIDSLRWMPQHGSNGFLRSVARRMVEAGHGVESNELMAAMVESHRGWQKHASRDSQRKLIGWCRRWLKWAMTRFGGGCDEATGANNLERHDEWNGKVRRGIPAAIKAGCTGITKVIAFLAQHLRMSKRLLWERADVIRQGIELEQQMLDQAQDVGVTPTRLIPMGVSTAVGDDQSVAVLDQNSLTAVSVPPTRSAEAPTPGAQIKTKESGFARKILLENLAEIRSIVDGLRTLAPGTRKHRIP